MIYLRIIIVSICYSCHNILNSLLLILFPCIIILFSNKVIIIIIRAGSLVMKWVLYKVIKIRSIIVKVTVYCKIIYYYYSSSKIPKLIYFHPHNNPKIWKKYFRITTLKIPVSSSNHNSNSSKLIKIKIPPNNHPLLVNNLIIICSNHNLYLPIRVPVLLCTVLKKIPKFTKINNNTIVKVVRKVIKKLLRKIIIIN